MAQDFTSRIRITKCGKAKTSGAQQQFQLIFLNKYIGENRVGSD